MSPATSGDTVASQDKIWTSESMPSQWQAAPLAEGGVASRVLEKRSCCELEVDACVEHVLNRSEARTACCLPDPSKSVNAAEQSISVLSKGLHFS